MGLYNSPFFILGATVRDNRRRILELAEDKQLELESEVCQKARSDLTNLRTRLSAELAWLPRVSPRKAAELIETLRCAPLEIRGITDCPKLAHLNLIATAFSEAKDQIQGRGEFVCFIEDIIYLVEAIAPEDLLREINEDRKLSGFQEVRSVEHIEGEWAERKRYYRGGIRAALDCLPSLTLIQVMRTLVSDMTRDGARHGPGLIHDIVDTYEVGASAALQKNAESIREIIQVLRNQASLGEAGLAVHMRNLEYATRHWISIAKPIQLSTRARGMSHDASRKLAYEIRGLGLDLYNKHEMLEQSLRIMQFLQKEFGDEHDLADLLVKELNTLSDIKSSRNGSDFRSRKKSDEISYEAEVGWIFKKKLSISKGIVSWGAKSCSLDSITWIRWGGVTRSSGTLYTVAVDGSSGQLVVELKDYLVYLGFVGKLWGAVSGRLIFEGLKHLESEGAIIVDGIRIENDGVFLKGAGFFNTKVLKFSWGSISIRSDNGVFYITARDSGKTFSASFSYLNGWNTHILECIIQMALKRPGLRRLSELLERGE